VFRRNINICDRSPKGRNWSLTRWRILTFLVKCSGEQLSPFGSGSDFYGFKMFYNLRTYPVSISEDQAADACAASTTKQTRQPILKKFNHFSYTLLYKKNVIYLSYHPSYHGGIRSHDSPRWQVETIPLDHAAWS
jgi:hypothetical protein